MALPVYYGGTPTSSSGYQSSSKKKPGPRGAGSPGVNVQPPPSSTTASSGREPDSSTTPTTGSGGSGSTPRQPVYMRYPVTYRPPVWGTADRQEQQIPGLPLVYRAQDSGDLRAAYWSDPESRAIIQAAARVYYRDYPNYNDQWAEKFWQEDILNASLNEGAPPAWQALQQIFTGQQTASRDGNSPPSSSSYSYSSGGGGGYSSGGGGGGGGSVSLTNPTSARGLLMQTMQSVLGRNPTNDEYKTFLQVLNEAEMANPNTASFEDGMAVGSGGVDPGVLALEFAQDQEDFTERQGDRYFRTFMQALAGGV